MYLNYLSAVGTVLNEGYNSGALEIPVYSEPDAYIYYPLANAFNKFGQASAYENMVALASTNYYTTPSPDLLLLNGTSFYSVMSKTFLFNTALWATISDGMVGAPAQPAGISSIISTMLSSLSLPSIPSIGFYQLKNASVENNLSTDIEWFISVLSNLHIGNFTIPTLPKLLLPSLANCMPFLPYLLDPQQTTQKHPDIHDAFSKQVAYFSNFTTDWCPFLENSNTNNISRATGGLITVTQLTKLCFAIENYVPVLLEIQQDFINQIVNDKVSPFNLTVSDSTLKSNADSYFNTLTSIFSEIAAGNQIVSTIDPYLSFDKRGSLTSFLYMLSKNQSYTPSLLNSFKYDISGLYSLLSTYDYLIFYCGFSVKLSPDKTPPPSFGLGSDELSTMYRGILNGSIPDTTSSSPSASNKPNSSNPNSTQNNNQHEPSQSQNSIPSLNQLYKHATGISIGGIVAIAIVLFFVSVAITICFWCWCCRTTARAVGRSATKNSSEAPSQSYSILTPKSAKQAANEEHFV